MASIKGIPRILLPQIPYDKIPDFENFLQEKGVNSERKDIPIKSIKPIQKNYNPEKVSYMMKNPSVIDDQMIIVTEDGYLVDGHHRWVAALKLGRNTIKALVCDCPLKKFLLLGHEFPGSFTKSVNEVTTYNSKLSEIFMKFIEKMPTLQELVKKIDEENMKVKNSPKVPLNTIIGDPRRRAFATSENSWKQENILLSRLMELDGYTETPPDLRAPLDLPVQRDGDNKENDDEETSGNDIVYHDGYGYRTKYSDYGDASAGTYSFGNNI